MRLPSDSKLTEDGLAPAGQGKLLLIACGALAREILALIEANQWHHMALTCLPAILHNRPEAIPDAVEAAVEKHRTAFERIFVVYADCGTGGLLEARCKALGVEMVAGPHCYSFFEGNAAFAAHDDEITAFYLTDFLVRQFDAFVTKPLKFDKHPELKEMYFGHYTKLVYQAQTNDPALTELAMKHAQTLGLEFERRFTGYGDLEVALASA
ncbi:DUF1638 domain-containing protein [Vannielia litorea]|uniref:DUF1638 domain-containing protein n=1 Tax=Vannielia litorea TaxID=1217970 RepID=UPI001C94273E|nr:DUF1638 domain-containing protein [Vannielia litorea]MBY6047048.1 DUF1638 domain-containing protein [Vannielia litorea]MBY6074462.1 DUF1638 domain-containing protein [Vannielia litorea]